MNIERLAWLAFLMAVVLYNVRFVPWDKAFDDGFFVSDSYLDEQKDKISNNKLEYNVYRTVIVGYVLFLLYQLEHVRKAVTKAKTSYKKLKSFSF